MAMRSGPAFSTNNSYSNPSSSNFLSRYNDALRRGYHVAPGIDHDTHNSVFGRQSAGRLVVQAPLLNRSEIYNAFRKRRFYASDDWNTKVDFSILNQPMGSIITHAGNPTIEVTVNDPDGESISSMAIFSGIAGSGNAPTQLAIVNNTNTLNYTHIVNSNLPYYYCLYIVQADGNKIWTAPIWYTKDDNLVVQPPVAGFDTLVTICSNNPVVLHDNSLNNPTSWWWTANGAYPVNSSLQHPTFNFANPGTYQVKLITTNTAGSDSIIKTIVVQSSPTVQIFPVDSICKGTSAQLLASGADSYVWNNGATDALISVSPSYNTSYTVSGWQAGCYDTAKVVVKVYQALQTPLIYSMGDTLESSYAFGNQWYYYNTLIAGATSQQYLPATTGIFQVQVSDSLGCKSEFSLPQAVLLGIAQDDLQIRNSYKVYPNPSQGIIHINSEAVHLNVRCKILSMSGYTVHEQLFAECSFSRPLTVNLSHLSKGIYMIKLETDLGVYESKLQLE
jgi:PKD repeat protein